MLLSGKQVKKLAARNGWLLVKFLPFANLEGEGIGKYKYHYGLNIPQTGPEFINAPSCSGGGLYFTYVKEGESNVWVNDHAYSIDLPDDAMVLYYYNLKKFKTTKLIIEAPWDRETYYQYIYLRSSWLLNFEQTPGGNLCAVKYDGLALQYIKEQTPEICLAAVQQFGLALKYVKEQTLEICLAAVKRDSWALEFVREQSPEICRAALLTNSQALSLVHNQSIDLCLATVRQNGLALQHVRDKTPEICCVAVQQTRGALQYG